jgi:hypothetical protein
MKASQAHPRWAQLNARLPALQRLIKDKAASSQPASPASPAPPASPASPFPATVPASAR